MHASVFVVVVVSGVRFRLVVCCSGANDVAIHLLMVAPVAAAVVVVRSAAAAAPPESDAALVCMAGGLHVFLTCGALLLCQLRML